MDAFCGFEKTADIPVLKQQTTTSRKFDGQVLIDEDIKKKWDKAKDGKDTTTTLIAVNEMVLRELNQIINWAMGDLVRLVERYGCLSVAGSCSAGVRSVVRLLEALEKMDLGKDELEKVKERLGQMKRRLELFNEVEEEVV